MTPKRDFQCAAKTQPKGLSTKYIRSPWFLMLSRIGVGQGWLQNIFSFFLFTCTCTNPISRWISASFCTVYSSESIYITKEKEKKEKKRNEFYAQMLFLVLKKRQLKRRVGCDDDLRQKDLEKKWVFHLCTEVLSYSPLCIRSRKRKFKRKWMKISKAD